MIAVPESPRWSFLSKNKQEQESKEGSVKSNPEVNIDAIKNLNYIAWFNGSATRIPDNAQLDIFDQAVIQHRKTVKKTSIGELKAIESASIYSMTNHFIN